MPHRDPYPRALNGVLASAAVVTLSVVTAMLVAAHTAPSGILLSVLLAALPVPLYVWLALWIDRFEAEPPWMLATTFAWGATIALVLSLLVNTSGEMVLVEMLGEAEAIFYATVLTAPIVEECAKGLALVLLCFWKPHEFDNVTDGIVYAAMVGLGFAMTENILFYGLALAEGGETFGSLLLVRGVLSPFAHPLFTSMTGISLGLMRQGPDPRARSGLPIMGLALAVLLHLIWNLSASTDSFFPVYRFVMVPLFGGVILLVASSLRREATILRGQLRCEVDAGQIDREELELMCTVRGRIRAGWRAWREGGWRGWRHLHAYHQTVTKLAFHRWRVSRGISLGADRDAAREDAFRSHVLGVRGSTSGGAETETAG